MQAGHYIAGRNYGIRYDERGVYPQCYVCNCINHGEQLLYYRFLVKLHGLELADRITEELLQAKHTTKNFAVDELLAMIEEYKARALRAGYVEL
jgi:hypothetical protein